MKRSRFPLAWLTLGMALVLGCDGGPMGPRGPRIEFSTGVLDLGTARTASVVLRNSGTAAVGPVELVTSAIRDAAGGSLPAAHLLTRPTEIPTLNPGDAITLELEVELGGTVQPGSYDATLTARAGTEASATLSLTLEIRASDDGTELRPTIVDPPSTLRQGDVVGLVTEVRNGAGELVESASVTWTVEPSGAGFFGSSGQFVGYSPGEARLVVRVGDAADSALVTITPRNLSGTFEVVGRGVEEDRYTSDLWVHDRHAYLGTWSARSRAGEPPLFGNVLFTWDVSDPSDPVRTDTLEVDARTVNDVKIRPDGELAVITHEGSEDGLNGISFLDLSDPAHPQRISRFTEGLQPGIHNTWIDGDYLYAVLDGVGSGLRILDISDLSSPRIVAAYWAGESFLHDVYVRDGLAFLSHWDAGLVILDVGNGVAGGSPATPVEVGRVPHLGGQTHNAWYWPEAGYAFVGEEDFSGTPGLLHVIDVRNPREPREVATFAVAGQTPHNVWLDEEEGILYAAWYGEGIRAVDVSGELMGDLARQGREIAGLRYNGGSGSCGTENTCSWAPQLHEGLVHVSDRSAGLVILRPVF